MVCLLTGPTYSLRMGDLKIAIACEQMNDQRVSLDRPLDDTCLRLGTFMLLSSLSNEWEGASHQVLRKVHLI